MRLLFLDLALPTPIVGLRATLMTALLVAPASAAPQSLGALELLIDQDLDGSYTTQAVDGTWGRLRVTGIGDDSLTGAWVYIMARVHIVKPAAFWEGVGEDYLFLKRPDPVGIEDTNLILGPGHDAQPDIVVGQDTFEATVESLLDIPDASLIYLKAQPLLRSTTQGGVPRRDFDAAYFRWSAPMQAVWANFIAEGSNPNTFDIDLWTLADLMLRVQANGAAYDRRWVFEQGLMLELQAVGIRGTGGVNTPTNPFPTSEAPNQIAPQGLEGWPSSLPTYGISGPLTLEVVKPGLVRKRPGIPGVDIDKTGSLGSGEIVARETPIELFGIGVLQGCKVKFVDSQNASGWLDVIVDESLAGVGKFFVEIPGWASSGTCKFVRTSTPGEADIVLAPGDRWRFQLL